LPVRVKKDFALTGSPRENITVRIPMKNSL
jgi:hypothetical protein